MDAGTDNEKHAGTGDACSGCRYAVPVYMGDGEDLMTACVYILRTGKKRPCPAGAACVVREPAENGNAGDAQRDRIRMEICSNAGRGAR